MISGSSGIDFLINSKSTRVNEHSVWREAPITLPVVQEHQEPAAPGAAQQGTPTSAQQLLSELLGGPGRQSAQLPGQQQNHGQGAGSFGAAPPAPPLPSGLPLESRLFTNNAYDAGKLSFTSPWLSVHLHTQLPTWQVQCTFHVTPSPDVTGSAY